LNQSFLKWTYVSGIANPSLKFGLASKNAKKETNLCHWFDVGSRSKEKSQSWRGLERVPC
ncbi:MAG: hypothetical protein AAF497_14305, partial [Planctomycetota bacterium]